jgi:GDPmannose 4,6-dehydratase
MWMILQADEAEDWVVATGKTTTVRLRENGFAETESASFEGEGVNEKVIDGIDLKKIPSNG